MQEKHGLARKPRPPPPEVSVRLESPPKLSVQKAVHQPLWQEDDSPIEEQPAEEPGKQNVSQVDLMIQDFSSMLNGFKKEYKST